MAKRSSRAATAQETLRIFERGHYISPAACKVSINAELDLARSRSLLYTPEQLDEVLEESTRHLGGERTDPQRCSRSSRNHLARCTPPDGSR